MSFEIPPIGVYEPRKRARWQSRCPQSTRTRCWRSARSTMTLHGKRKGGNGWQLPEDCEQPHLPTTIKNRCTTLRPSASAKFPSQKVKLPCRHGNQQYKGRRNKQERALAHVVRGERGTWTPGTQLEVQPSVRPVQEAPIFAPKTISPWHLRGGKRLGENGVCSEWLRPGAA